MHNRRGASFVSIIITISVVGCLLLVLAILIVTWGRKSKEMARSANCMANLNSTGKALVMYAADNNDQFPLVEAPAAWDSTPTGTNRDKGPDANTPRSITSVLFMLVRDGQPTAMFRCPSDYDATVPDAVKDPNGNYLWDFQKRSDVSYSFQLPLDNNHYTREVGNSEEVQALQTMNAAVVLMADKAPDTDPAGFNGGAGPDQQRPFMSPNHSKGEVIQCLRADFSVRGNVKTPACGYNNDYIYGASSDPNAVSSNGGPAHQAARKYINDSVLAGPK